MSILWQVLLDCISKLISSLIEWHQWETWLMQHKLTTCSPINTQKLAFSWVPAGANPNKFFFWQRLLKDMESFPLENCIWLQKYWSNKWLFGKICQFFSSFLTFLITVCFLLFSLSVSLKRELLQLHLNYFLLRVHVFLLLIKSN